MGDVIVLCYHAVSDSWPAALSVTRRELEQQMQRLVRRGYVGATFHQAVTDPPASRVVAVTFDDGYRSVGELAFPILAEAGFPATVFVTTDFVAADAPLSWPGIDQWLGGSHEHELMPLTWEELRRLHDAGWEVGSHTRSHPRLTALDDQALARELRGSRDCCEQLLGTACRSLAYPYGDVDARVVDAARAAGYEVAGTLPNRLGARLPLAYPRIGVYRPDGELRFRAKISPAVRRARASILWKLIEPLAALPAHKGRRSSNAVLARK
jgi:peptidoglycan/xylan/chitin deacetylase (PgdA/CDA1 family)